MVDQWPPGSGTGAIYGGAAQERPLPMTPGAIHEEHPFRPPPEQRDPVRRLRGRLVAPVTIITAGTDEAAWTGLTVSSLVVSEGSPPLVYCLFGPTTDLIERIAETERFLVHVCEAEHRRLADVFAGIEPSPGGMFAGRKATQTDHGPRLEGFPATAGCTVVSGREESYNVLVTARIDEVSADELTDPLTYFRGGYRTLGD
ncbi:MAG: flavin reductase family protein [Acidimicrobiia bacterium]